jgi:immune inhibitor A
MGLPDFYPTSSSAQDACNPALEYWDLMDAGEYSNYGYTPNEYSAWEKEAMGWMKIDTLKTATDVTLKPLSEGGTAYRIMNDSDATGHEYYIVENVQKTGWNAAIKGHGMLIYHVDYNANAFSLDWNSVNNTIGHSRMTIFPADGLLISSYDSKYTGAQYQASHSGDPFPGTSNVYSFTDTTSPEKSTVYTGTTKLMGKPITDIAEASDGTITFKFMGGTSGIREAITDHTVNGDNRIFSTNGMYMGTDMDVLPKGLYIRNGKKIVK